MYLHNVIKARKKLIPKSLVNTLTTVDEFLKLRENLPEVVMGQEITAA